MFQIRSLVFAFLIALSFCGASYGAFKGDDKEPFYTTSDPFWATNGKPKFFSLYNAKDKEFQILTSAWYYAFTNLEPTHVMDSKGGTHGHFHVRDDYPQKLNGFLTDYTAQANAYWDVVFQNKSVFHK